MKVKKSKPVIVAVSFNDETVHIIDAIRREAKAESRTLSSMIRIILTEHINRFTNL